MTAAHIHQRSGGCTEGSRPPGPSYVPSQRCGSLDLRRKRKKKEAILSSVSKDWQSDKLLPLQHLLVLLHPSSHGKTDTDKHWKHLLWPICVLCTANMSRTKRFSSTGTRHRPQLILIKSWTFNTPITSAMLIRMISFDLPLRKCKHKISDTASMHWMCRLTVTCWQTMNTYLTIQRT